MKIKHGFIKFFTVIVVIYVFYYYLVGRNLSYPILPYYNYLIDSLFHGKVDLIINNTKDISVYNGKNYMYWGPAPILFIIPFYLFGGVGVSDTIYTLIAGLMNVFIFYFTLKQFNLYFKIQTNQKYLFLITAVFALCSPNFYLSLGGRVWHTYQIVATTYLLLFFYFYFKSLNDKLNFKYLIISLTFCCLAWLSRYTLIFHMLFFIYPIYKLLKSVNSFKLKRILTLSTISIFFGLILLIYNYSRFGNIFETGFKYQLHDARFNDVFNTQKFFSFDYFFYNIFYYFLNNIRLSINSPFTLIDVEGNSVFAVYPFLILLAYLLQKKYFIKPNIFKFIISIVILLNIFVLLLFVGTGWVQFGNRYFFDVIPLLLFLTSFVIGEIPMMIPIILLTYGTLINILGSLTFYRYF